MSPTVPMFVHLVSGIVMGVVFWQYRNYRNRMEILAVAMILEAWKVAEDYPDAYPAYRDQAVSALNDHACSHLIRLLPDEKET